VKTLNNIIFGKTIILKFSLFFILSFFLFSCVENKKSNTITEPTSVKLKDNKYATGFSLNNINGFDVLEISHPWPNSKKNYQYLLKHKSDTINQLLSIFEYDGIIEVPIEKIIVTSTTHIPALELLGMENTLIGFPGTHYVSSEKTRLRIDKGEVRELGNNETINTEITLDLKPDILVAYGIGEQNKALETIHNSGTSVLYNGDWVEASPLGKAEWIKFFGILYDKTKEADSIFDIIETNYMAAKTLAQNIKNQPKVLCGAMHNNVWYLPQGTSSEAQILKDANVNYLWSDTKGKGSLALNFESVFEKAQDAALWLSPSYYGTYEELTSASTHYSQFNAFKNKSIYSFANTTGPSGGVLYYELGTARPDLVLKDIIKISHPTLLTEYTTYFFKPLQ
jgi:iron complex transport system substrate-binding protein